MLSLHGEVTDADVDIYDRERVFVERSLARLVRDHPALRIVVEHVTTREAAQFVESAGANVAATITPQHLLWSRNAMLVGGVRPHLYCLPILKRETHRRARSSLAATSGSPEAFLGTDSAPRARRTEERACGCAGCYSAPLALELYAKAFDDAGALRAGSKASRASMVRRSTASPRTRTSDAGVREPWTVPAESTGTGTIVPLRAGETVRWRLLTELARPR